MLTIQNYKKLVDRYIVDDWKVVRMHEGNHNNTYIVRLHKVDSSRIHDTCTIMLERNPLPQFSSTHPPELAYFFIFDSQRTNICVTADWISDMDNMVGQLGHILKENDKVKW